jgi:hypothetical protein
LETNFYTIQKSFRQKKLHGPQMDKLWGDTIRPALFRADLGSALSNQDGTIIRPCDSAIKGPETKSPPLFQTGLALASLLNQRDIYGVMLSFLTMQEA